MSNVETLKVFISSTTEDLQDYRESAIRFVHGLGMVPIAMEGGRAEGKTVEQTVFDWMQASNVYVGIFAWNKGSPVRAAEPADTSANSDETFTQLEYRLAEELKLPRLILMTDPHGPWLVKLIDQDRRPVEAFREKVSRNLYVRHFRDLHDFCLELTKSLVAVLRETPIWRSWPDEVKDFVDIANRIGRDLAVRRAELAGKPIPSDHRWLIQEIGRCNLDDRYIPRLTARKEFAVWLQHSASPFFLLVGSSGIGKTNFLIDELGYFVPKSDENATPQDPHWKAQVGKKDRRFRPVIFFPLRVYDSAKTLVANLGEYLVSGVTLSNSTSLPKLAEKIDSFIRSGEVLLILDGLDELARREGQEACKKLLETLKTMTGPQSTVVISCREHIYNRLKRNEMFVTDFYTVRLNDLEDDVLDKALVNRIGPSHPAYNILHDRKAPLRELAKHPLLLELLLQVHPSQWRKLSKDSPAALIYHLWLGEVGGLVTPARTWEFTELVQDVARIMLELRSDVVHVDELQRRGLPLKELQRAAEGRFSVLVEQVKDEWGFIHDSFREYGLSKTIERELRSHDYKLLKETASLDYVGAETFRFLHELIPLDESLLEKISAALDRFPKSDRPSWNNFVQNCFEIIGMIGVDRVEGYIDLAARLLGQERETLTNQTKYNIVRCLERLHPSAPRPFWEHVFEMNWEADPNERRLGAAAVRGFHLTCPTIGYGTPVEFIRHYQENSALQERVSETLVSLLESCAGNQKANDGLLEVNCSLALIRWLHASHAARVFGLHKRLRRESRGNLFHAFLRLPERERLLEGNGEFFQGMYLYFVGPEFGRLKIKNFRVENVTFLECKHWQCKFENPLFPEPNRREFSLFEPSYRYEQETRVEPPAARPPMDGSGRGGWGDRFRFSVFYPEKTRPEDIGRIIAYGHVESVVPEVVRDAARRMELPGNIPMRAGSEVSRLQVTKYSVIKVTPDVPGLEFDALEASMPLWEEMQSVEFRFRPSPSAVGQVCRGWVHFWLEGMVLGDVPVSIFVANMDVPDVLREALAEANARPYRAVFPSYSHEDADVVERMEVYATAFGDDYLRDVHRLRTGQRWNPEIMLFIKRADVFQLFWSQNSANSQYVAQEWRQAIEESTARPNPHFVRPVYWTPKPATPIPSELQELHFARIPL